MAPHYSVHGLQYHCVVTIVCCDLHNTNCHQVIEEAMKRLERRHKEHIILYDPNGVRRGGGGGRGREGKGKEGKKGGSTC